MQLISFLWLLSMLGLSVQDEQVTFQTIDFFNTEFLVDTDWRDIPVDKTNGEDINSEIFGGINYPPITSSQLSESRLSIAQRKLEIGLEFKNHTSKTWIIESIDLLVINQYEITKSMESGTWDVGSRTNDFHPIFQLETGKEKIVQLIEEEELLPEGDFQDTYYIFEVNTEKLSSAAIYEFQFEIMLSRIGGQQEKLVLSSDRTYFLATP